MCLYKLILNHNSIAQFVVPSTLELEIIIFSCNGIFILYIAYDLYKIYVYIYVISYIRFYF